MNSCPRCGSKEHNIFNCPHLLFKSCPKCGGKEHNVFNCPHIFFTSCSKCGSKEHSTMNCPHGLFLNSNSNSVTKKHIYNNSTSESSGENSLVGLGYLIILIGVIIILLLVPIALSVTFAAASLYYKKRKITLYIFSILGGVYLLLDLYFGLMSLFIINTFGISLNLINFLIYFNSIGFTFSAYHLLTHIILQNKAVQNTYKYKKNTFLIYLFVIASSLFLPCMKYILNIGFIKNPRLKMQDSYITKYELKKIQENFCTFKKNNKTIHLSLIDGFTDTIHRSDSIIIINFNENRRKRYYIDENKPYWIIISHLQNGFIDEGGGKIIFDGTKQEPDYFPKKTYLNLDEERYNQIKDSYKITIQEKVGNEMLYIVVLTRDIKYHDRESDIGIIFIKNDFNDYINMQTQKGYISAINYTKLNLLNKTKSID